MTVFPIVIWLVALLAAVAIDAHMPLAVGLLVVLLAAVPLWVAYAYVSAINLQHGLNQVFVPRWWHHLLAGHLVRVPALLVISLWFGIEVLADLLENSTEGALWLAVAAGLGGALSAFFNEHLTNYKPYYRTRMALRFGVPVAGALSALGWALLHLGPPTHGVPHHTGTSPPPP